MTTGRSGEVFSPVGQLLSSVEPEEVKWLWPSWLALGKLVLFDGDPGLGKSAMTLDLAARVSAGKAFPDGTECEPAGVVVLSAEDGLHDTIRPRLDAAGADVSRILALATVPDENGHDRPISIPEDIPLIEKGIERVDARLIVVDPLMAFLSGATNSHGDQDVRRALAPFAGIAERTGACALVIRHLNKSPGNNPLYRGGGSIGIIAAARIAFVVGKDPEDDNRRVLAPTKNNLARLPRSLSFVVTETATGTVRVEWLGETSLDAATLLAAPVHSEEHRDLIALRDAVAEMLEDHGGIWEGEPKQLLDQLEDKDLPDLPDRPDELSKLLLKLGRAGHAFTVSRRRKRSGEGGQKVVRILRLEARERREAEPPNSVHGGNGVHHERQWVVSDGVHAQGGHPGGTGERAMEADNLSMDDWHGHGSDCRCDLCLRRMFP